MFQDRIDKLNEMIQKNNKIVFFGGAGVSTASGIPDFRSENGLYNMDFEFYKGKDPEYLLSRECLYNNPKLFYKFYRDFMDVRNFDPNIAHYKLAELEKAGKMLGVVTQNIDGLHQKAGSEKVFQIHGTTQRVYCSKCGKEYPVDYIFTCPDEIPKCEKGCRGLIRPAVTLYSEQLPKDQVNDAIDAIYNADMLIIAGTSLTVYPAASFVSYFGKGDMVLINRTETPYDSYANLGFREDISDGSEKNIV